MRCASTRSLVATAIQKWSRATARICWPCMLRRPANERTRATGAAPRLVCRAPPQIRDTLALALPLRDARTTITFDPRPLRDARTTITFDPRPNQIRLLRRGRIYTSAPAVNLRYRPGDLKCRGRVGEVL